MYFIQFQLLEGEVWESMSIKFIKHWSIVNGEWIASSNLSSNSCIIEGLQNSMGNKTMKYNFHTQNAFNLVWYREFHDDYVLIWVAWYADSTIIIQWYYFMQMNTAIVQYFVVKSCNCYENYIVWYFSHASHAISVNFCAALSFPLSWIIITSIRIILYNQNRIE